MFASLWSQRASECAASLSHNVDRGGVIEEAVFGSPQRDCDAAFAQGPIVEGVTPRCRDLGRGRGRGRIAGFRQDAATKEKIRAARLRVVVKAERERTDALIDVVNPSISSHANGAVCAQVGNADPARQVLLDGATMHIPKVSGKDLKCGFRNAQCRVLSSHVRAQSSGLAAFISPTPGSSVDMVFP